MVAQCSGTTLFFFNHCNPTLSTLSFLRTFPPNIICFREGDCPSTTENVRILSILEASPELKYSPWAISMVKGLGNKTAKQSTDGADGGGSKGGNDDGGDGGGGGGRDDDGGEDDEGDRGDGGVVILPLLTLSLAVLHLGYCVFVSIKEETFDARYLQTGVGLFGLLLLSALRLKCRSGVDAYILGLGASTGVMVCTGERCLVKKESNAAGFVSVFAASMSLIFSAALYNNI